jgi:hypothetical protein
MKRFVRSLGFVIPLAIAVLVFFVPQVQAVTVDGSLTGDGYGAALAIQGNPTGFGDSTIGDGTSAGGSELDAAYGQISGGYLYLFLAGNHENNGNHVNIFIAGGAAGQNILAAPTTATMGGAMNGSVFSPGFSATFALDINDYSGTDYVEEYSLFGTPAGGYVGSIGLTGGIGSGTPGVATIGDNQTNGGGITGSSATSAQALSVSTGLEIAIPLSAIGYTGGSIMVLADINGGGDGYLSNQFLPGLPSGTGNVGGGGPYTGGSSGQFNFGSTSGQYFTVIPIPEPSTIGLVLVGLLGAFAIRRRKA